MFADVTVAGDVPLPVCATVSVPLPVGYSVPVVGDTDDVREDTAVGEDVPLPLYDPVPVDVTVRVSVTVVVVDGVSVTLLVQEMVGLGDGDGTLPYNTHSPMLNRTIPLFVMVIRR